MMKTYTVTATVLDEVCIADRHDAGNEYIGRDYIPGTAWWGAIAAITGIKRGEKPPDLFRAMFYSNEIIFTNLYPKKPLRAQPIPLSARTKKSAPGFHCSEGEALYRDSEGEHYPGGVKDLLLGNAHYYKEDWEPFTGWFTGDPPDCEKAFVQMVMRGHNDRSQRSGTTSEGQLFARQNIKRNEQFEGALYALSPQAEKNLACFHEKYLNGNPLEIPVGRQPGYVRIELEDEGDNLPYWQRHELLPAQVGRELITVTLLADTILVDHFLRPLSYLPAANVANALNLPEESVELYKHFSAVREVLGWNGAYMRPRETELALAAGSAFCYTVDWPNNMTEDEIDEIIDCLKNWQLQGIGLRTAEGFGEMRINDPFHYEFEANGGDGNGAE